MSLRHLRILLWGAAAAAGLAYLGLIVWTDNRIHGHTGNGPSEAVAEAIVPRFALSDHTGAPVTEATYRGRWLLVFFGFSNCPDICPPTLAELADVVDGLGPAAREVQALFVSVDPARDTPDALAEYVAAFHPAIVGLTGTEDALAKAAASFRAYFERVEAPGAAGGYTMSHTSAVYLISPDGRFERVYAYGTPVADILADLMPRLE
jgi:protein SCO1/2